MVALFDPVRGTSEPDRVWTITNVSEATPDILSPLCWSIWGRVLEEAWLALLHSFGALSAAEAVRSSDPNRHTTNAIYGRQAFNIDVVRRAVVRLPGIDADDFERDIMGTVRPGLPKDEGAPARIPLILAKMPRSLLKGGPQVRAKYAETRDWWRTTVLAGDRRGRPIDSLHEARDMFWGAFHAHLKIRLQLQIVQSLITDAALAAGDPTLGDRAFSGLGSVLEIEMADDLWRLAHDEVSEADFVAAHGFHGPNEGNVFTRSWREDPTRLRATATAMAGRTDLTRPKAREQAATAAARAAQAELLAKTPALRRPVVRKALGWASTVVRDMEIGKSAYVMALDGCRAAARAVGAQQVAAGRLAEVDDAFFLTVEELDELVEGRLPEAADQVAFRRAAREEYRRMRLPAVFSGIPEVSVDTRPTVPDTSPITGAASGGGRAAGRARVVIDPNDDVDLEPGDILVCRFTDPSWAPLFTMAEALVIDLGGAASHGALVARELGIPFVIGTGDGTERIREGDRIAVDGAANTVLVLDRGDQDPVAAP